MNPYVYTASSIMRLIFDGIAALGRLTPARYLLALSLATPSVSAGPPNCPDAGMVLSDAKISNIEGGLSGVLDNGDLFGQAAANVGDLDNDGVTDLAVGAAFDDDGGQDRGAVWVLFMNSNGTVRAEQKISDLEGGFNGALDNQDQFGVSVASAGDLDDDGVPDLAVAANLDDDGGVNRGALWILFMNPNGTVRAEQKISDLEGGFNGVLDDEDQLGRGVAGAGDLDDDGVPDLAAGTNMDDDGGLNHGALWVLFMNTDGTVRAEQKISDLEGGFNGVLDDQDQFGTSLAGPGDLDDDGVPDLAVGALFDDDGGFDRGAVWVLFMNANGTVRAEQKVSDLEGGFSGTLDDQDQFGISIAGPGDLNGDGVPDLAFGARDDDDGGPGRGAVWVLFMNPDGTVGADQKISSTVGGFTGVLDDSDQFGASVAGLGDIDGDGLGDLAVGARRDDDGGTDRGAVWILSLDGCAAVPACCPGNADGLGGVNFADVTSVLANFGAIGTPGVQNPGDANCDGVVNFADVTSVLANFNLTCP